MHPRQSPSGGAAVGRGERAGFHARHSKPLQSNDLRPIPRQRETPHPPPKFGYGYCHIPSRIFSALSPPYVAFRPHSARLRFAVSPIWLALPTRPPRVAVASVPNLLCGRPIGDTNL